MSRPQRLRMSQFTVGGVLGKGFSAWGKGVVTLTILMTIIYSPLVVVRVMLLVAEPSPDVGILALFGAGFLLERLLGTLATAAVIYAVFQQLRGERAGVGGSLRICVSRILPVLGAAILLFMATVLPMVPGMLLWTANRSAGIVVFLLGLAVALYVSLMLWVAIPPAIVENAGPLNALKRSVSLTHGHKGQIFLIMLVVGFIVGAAGGVAGFATAASRVGSVVAELAITILGGALGATMTAVGYYELRQSKEGVGVEDLIKVFE